MVVTDKEQGVAVVLMQVGGRGGEPYLVLHFLVNTCKCLVPNVQYMCPGTFLGLYAPPLLPLYVVLCKGMGLLRSFSTCLYDK